MYCLHLPGVLPGVLPNVLLPLRYSQDEFPGIFRFTASVFPSEDDDVVTSPYNALLAASKLVEHADCVLPVENQALIEICNRCGLVGVCCWHVGFRAHAAVLKGREVQGFGCDW